MNQRLTEVQLDELERLEREASPGDWMGAFKIDERGRDHLLANALRNSFPSLLEEIREARRCGTWEADHQRASLRHVGGLELADEFPFGCDAIIAVAEALVAARTELLSLRAEVERLKGERAARRLPTHMEVLGILKDREQP